MTSRAILSIPEEQAFPLSPLKERESFELFVKRVRRLQPSFVPTEDEEDAIEELVALLEHLPLAIELAAARIRILTPRKC